MEWCVFIIKIKQSFKQFLILLTNYANFSEIIKSHAMNHAIILFDGVCNLCDNTVQFILKRDKKGYFRFASLQSEQGQELLQKHNLPTAGFDSFVLVENDKVYQKSKGALRVCRRLGGGWPLLYGFIIIPAFIRNFVYSWVARNRYRWFGKKETCMLPKPEWRERFLG